MEENVDLDRSNIFYLENSMFMYGIYNTETIEKICHTTKKPTWKKRLFSAGLTHWYNCILS